MSAAIQYIETAERRLAYRHAPAQPTVQHPPEHPSAPGIFFLGGFNSHMGGAKAQALAAYCQRYGLSFTCFDYRGHGASSGVFSEGCIGDWLDDALLVFDHMAARSASGYILVGSSMGAWIATLLALRRGDQVRALLGVASALDFTETLVQRHLSAAQRETLRRTGQTQLSSCHPAQSAYIISQRLIDEGADHYLLKGEIALQKPVALLHGLLDEDVPWRTSLCFARRLRSRDVDLTLLPTGDHRLSTDAQLALLCACLTRLRAAV